MNTMLIKIMGTRGSTAISGTQFSKYGGNSQCAVVSYGEDSLIFDAGTGILSVPAFLEEQHCKPEINLFLTHYHMDHVAGLGMFSSLNNPHVTARIYGPSVNGRDCEGCVQQVFSPPLWPIVIAKLPSCPSFQTLAAEQELTVAGFSVRTCELNHPGSALGYRIDRNGKSFCYIFDHEEDVQPDRRLDHFVAGCDLLLCDAPLTQETYQGKRGFGHSTRESMIALAQRAGVKQLVLSHHVISNADMQLDFMQKDLSAQYPGVIYAQEGMVFSL